MFDLCLTEQNKKRCNQFDYNVLFRFSCDPAGIRTQDPIIKSDVLYQLSYGISFLLHLLSVKRVQR